MYARIFNVCMQNHAKHRDSLWMPLAMLQFALEMDDLPLSKTYPRNIVKNYDFEQLYEIPTRPYILLDTE